MLNMEFIEVCDATTNNQKRFIYLRQRKVCVKISVDDVV